MTRRATHHGASPVIRVLLRISLHSLRDRREEISLTAEPALWVNLFQALDVDDEAIAHVVVQHPLIGFVDLLDRDQLDVRCDALPGAEIELLLRLADSAD